MYLHIKKKKSDVLEKIPDLRCIIQLFKILCTQLENSGYYALDLITWSYIGMQIVITDGIDAIEALGSIFNHITKDSSFIKAQMVKYLGYSRS